MSIKKLWRTYGPSRASGEWAVVVPKTRKRVLRVGRPLQIIGSKGWTLSILFFDQKITKADDFFEDSP